MFVQPVALQPVPAFARVAPAVLTQVLSRLLAEPDALTDTLDDGFRHMEARQPSLAEFVSNELAAIEGPRLSAVAYFLAVLVHQAFEEAFGARVGRVQLSDLTQTVDNLVTDGQLRTQGGDTITYSEDAIALGQPALVTLLRSELDRVLEEAPQEAKSLSIDALYEMLLVELLALTNAVAPQ
jgi:hypothetical protein